jgi:ribosomal protein S18 acetylase RimI-like enzyme
MLTPAHEVVRLDKAGYARARRALARAFLDYRLMVYAVPDASRRAPGVAALYASLLSDSFRHGQVYVTRDGSGVACWLPAERAIAGFWRQLRAGMLAVPLKFGWSACRRLLPYDGLARKLHHQHADMPHWYLSAIGVEPERQGQGVGSALMQPVLSRADADGTACYLETHREQNVRLYERHGFEVVCRTDVPGHEVPIWAMLRQPMASKAIT